MYRHYQQLRNAAICIQVGELNGPAFTKVHMLRSFLAAESPLSLAVSGCTRNKACCLLHYCRLPTVARWRGGGCSTRWWCPTCWRLGYAASGSWRPAGAGPLEKAQLIAVQEQQSSNHPGSQGFKMFLALLTTPVLVYSWIRPHSALQAAGLKAAWCGPPLRCRPCDAAVSCAAGSCSSAARPSPSRRQCGHTSSAHASCSTGQRRCAFRPAGSGTWPSGSCGRRR